MQSRKIDETQIPQGGDMAQIAKAVAAQQQKNMITLNKDLLPSKGKYYSNDLYVKKLSTIDIKNLSTLTGDTDCRDAVLHVVLNDQHPCFVPVGGKGCKRRGAQVLHVQAPGKAPAPENVQNAGIVLRNG